MQRLADLATPSPEVQAFLDTMAKGPEGVDTSPSLYLTIAHNPAMLVALRHMGETLRTSARLEAREREVIIHRVSARCENGYEWGIHAKLLAEPLGLGEDWLQATWSGEPSDLPEPSHAVLAQAVDELHDTTTVTDETWTRLREHFDEAQIVEIVFMVGYYHLVSYAERMFQLEPEPWARPAPDTPPAR
jgi:alkylhydroperoxidase family enzyme